jgi:hypothetical protein
MRTTRVLTMLLASILLFGSTLTIDVTPAAAVSTANVRLIADGRVRRVVVTFSDPIASWRKCRNSTLAGKVYIDYVARGTTFDIRGFHVQLGGINMGQTLPIRLSRYAIRISPTRVEEGDSSVSNSTTPTANLVPIEVYPSRMGTLSVYTKRAGGTFEWIPFALNNVPYSSAQMTLQLERKDPTAALGACDGIWMINTFMRA